MESIIDKQLKNADILIVDNMLERLKALTNILTEKGYEVVRIAGSGEIAINSIKIKIPDIILLSSNLPVLNGFEVCRKIKAIPETHKIPIILITENTETKDRIIGFEAGAIDFITKPYHHEEINAIIKNHLYTYLLSVKLEEANKKLYSEIKNCESQIYDLYNKNELCRLTLLSIKEGVICTDNQGNITLINDVAKNITGLNGVSAAGIPVDKVINIANNKNFKELSENLIKKSNNSNGNIKINNHMVVITDRNNKKRVIDCTASSIKDKDGNQRGSVLTFRDITQKKAREKEVEYLSFHDQLTGLYNRRYFEEKLKRLDKSSNYPLTLVMGDLNGLKIANDAFGHQLGDELLKKASEILKNCFRKNDIICRYGGDEFTIILTNTDYSIIKTIVNRIKEMTKNLNIKNGMLSITFGWETKKNEDEDIDLILKKAEDYMYKKKLLECPSMRHSIIDTIINTLYEKNRREEEHSKRVSELCLKIGIEMNFNERDLNDLRMAGLLHDIGKIVLIDEILNKKGKFTELEIKKTRRHPEVGYRILSSIKYMSEVAEIILAHHERWDGTGYPKGLKENDIPLMARIISIADAYDAMTSDRPYRKSISNEAAVLEIKNNSGKQFDPEIAEIFIEKLLK